MNVDVPCQDDCIAEGTFTLWQLSCHFSACHYALDSSTELQRRCQHVTKALLRRYKRHHQKITDMLRHGCCVVLVMHELPSELDIAEVKS